MCLLVSAVARAQQVPTTNIVYFCVENDSREAELRVVGPLTVRWVSGVVLPTFALKSTLAPLAFRPCAPSSVLAKVSAPPAVRDTSAVSAEVLSNDGRYALSGDGEGVLRLWLVPE